MTLLDTDGEVLLIEATAVGAWVSIVKLSALFGSDPSTFGLPAASRNLSLSTLTLPGTMLLGAGVKIAV